MLPLKEGTALSSEVRNRAVRSVLAVESPNWGPASSWFTEFAHSFHAMFSKKLLHYQI